MKENINCEFAIFGSSPLAIMLACSLSKIHKRETIIFANLASPLLPIRQFDCSADLITRPQSWRILGENIPQLQQLLKDFPLSPNSSSSHPLELINPLFIAREKRGALALNHMRNIAQYYGFILEGQPIKQNIEQIILMRDILMLNQRIFSMGIKEWLAKNNVKILPSQNTKIKTNFSAGIKFISENKNIIAKRLIFVDDEAILNFMPAKERLLNFKKIPTSSLMVGTMEKIIHTTIFDVDNGSIFYREPSGIVNIIHHEEGGEGNFIADYFEEREKLDINITGKAQFENIISRDGAGIFGSVKEKKISFLAGFGKIGIFLVPAIARMILSKATEFEYEYFTARQPRKDKKIRSNIADYTALRKGKLKGK